MQHTEAHMSKELQKEKAANEKYVRKLMELEGDLKRARYIRAILFYSLFYQFKFSVIFHILFFTVSRYPLTPTSPLCANAIYELLTWIHNILQHHHNTTLQQNHITTLQHCNMTARPLQLTRQISDPSDRSSTACRVN